MKKIVLLASVLFSLPVFAADFTPQETNTGDSLCVQIITPAVNPQGTCEIFPTPCDVPEGWRTVSSCDLIRPPALGVRLDNYQQRRWEQQRTKLQEIEKNQKLESDAQKRLAEKPRFTGTGLLTRRNGEDNRRLKESMGESFFGKKTTMPKFTDTEAYARFRSLVSDKPGLAKTEITKLEELQTRWADRGYRKPRFETSTQMNRKGYLSTDSFYNQRGVKDIPGEVRPWVSYEAQRKPKLAKRKGAEAIHLRKIFRASPTGNLSGEALLKERERQK